MQSVTPQPGTVLHQRETLCATSLFTDPVISHASFSTFQPNIFTCHNSPQCPYGQTNTKTCLNQWCPLQYGVDTLYFQLQNQETLLNDSGHNAGTDSTTAFANREATSFRHGDWLTKFDFDFHIVAGHTHFCSTPQRC